MAVDRWREEPPKNDTFNIQHVSLNISLMAVDGWREESLRLRIFLTFNFLLFNICWMLNEG